MPVALRVAVKSQWKADGDDDSFPFVDYDEYDAQVFKLPSRTSNRFDDLNVCHYNVSFVSESA